MMAVTTPQRSTVNTPDTSVRRVVSIAVYTTGRLLRHPLNIAGAGGSLILMWRFVGDTAPVLPRDSVYLAGAMLPLAATVFFTANLVTMRWRHLPELLESLPTSVARRLVGMSAAALGPALLGVGLTVLGLLYLVLGDPIGEIAWLEIAAGPLMVFAFGTVGVVLGYWLPHAVVAPLALLALTQAQLNASPNITTFQFSMADSLHFEWIFPWMSPSHHIPVEMWAESRPDLAHALFLLLAPVVLVAIAILGARRRYVSVVGLTVAGLVSVVALSATMPEPTDSFDLPAYYASQQCEEREAVTYCVSPMYSSWVDHWEETVDGVGGLVPTEVDWVVQRTPWFSSTDDWANQVDADVARASYRWDRPGGVPSRALALGFEVAQTAVGLATTQGEQCQAVGQARAVAAVWLAAASLQDGEQALDRAIDTYPVTFQAVDMPHHSATEVFVADARLARDLLELPTTQVTDTLIARWDEVVDPSTTSGELAGWFDLSAPSRPDLELEMEPCR